MNGKATGKEIAERGVEHAALATKASLGLVPADQLISQAHVVGELLVKVGMALDRKGGSLTLDMPPALAPEAANPGEVQA